MINTSLLSAADSQNEII